MKRRNVLFVGIGGGMDIFGCLPLYFKYSKDSSICMTLANLTFVCPKKLQRECALKNAIQVHPWVFEILPVQCKKTEEQEEYFPERRLANFLQHPIYAISPYDKDTYSDKKDPTISMLSEYFANFLREKEINEIYYMDGGCDSLLCGWEEHLATPTEDLFTLKFMEQAIEIAATTKSFEIKKRFLVIVGMDLDVAHGIQLVDLENRIAKLKTQWVDKMSMDQEHVAKYCEAVLACNPEHSIVQSLVVASIQNNRGYKIPVWLRKRVKKLLIPLTDRLTQMFCYLVQDVVQENVFWPGISREFTCKKLDQYIGNEHEKAFFHHFMARFFPHGSGLSELCWNYRLSNKAKKTVSNNAQ